MKLFRFLISNLCLIFLIGCASIEIVRVPDLTDNPHFYCFSKKDQAPSYILGTIHMFSRNILPNFIWIPFKTSKIVFLEITNFSYDRDLTFRKKDQNKDSPKAKSVTDFLSDSQQKELKRVFSLAKITIPIEDLTFMALSNLYSESLEQIERSRVVLKGSRDSVGLMDQEISDLAYQHNIPRMKLDNFDPSLIANDPIWLKNIPESPPVEDPKLVAQEYQILIDAYFSGSEENLSALAKDHFDSFILAGRNKSWVSDFSPFLGSQTFIAVGAAHLYGPEGLIKLLEKSGYKFFQLKNKSDLELCSKLFQN